MELDDLHALFGHSDVPRGMFLKFQVSKHNRDIADKGRQEKEDRQRLLQERQEEHVHHPGQYFHTLAQMSVSSAVSPRQLA